MSFALESRFLHNFAQKLSSVYLNTKYYNFNKTPNILLCQNCYASTERKTGSKNSFLESISKRRGEARRSIIVKVNTPEANDNLFTYCNRYGRVKNMYHYVAGLEKSENFILVEFHSDSEVTAVSSPCFYKLDDFDEYPIPVESPFLRFLSDIKKKKLKKDVSHLTVQNGTKIVTDTEIIQLLSKSKNLSEQMTTLQKLTCLGETGTRLRYFAARQIELALSGMFPDVAVLPFGSTVTGFGKEGCDLNLALRLNSEQKEKEESRLAFRFKGTSIWEGKPQMQSVLGSVADILHLFLPGCDKVKMLPNSSPKIKYSQTLTGLNIDLSMIHMSGILMSELVYTMCSIDNRIKPLIFAVQKWGELAKVTENSEEQLITNFSLSLLVLAFLQNVEIIPSVNHLFKMADPSDKIATEDGFNCNFLRDISKLQTTSNQDSLETLLLKFFEYYSRFDFQSNAVSLSEGTTVIKPDHSPLYIVNPLKRTANITNNVTIEQVKYLQMQIRNAMLKLKSPSLKKNWGILEFMPRTPWTYKSNSYYVPQYSRQ